jgi:hypothetical protein
MVLHTQQNVDCDGCAGNHKESYWSYTNQVVSVVTNILRLFASQFVKLDCQLLLSLQIAEFPNILAIEQ